ncbi:vasorin-like [Anguilla anguilla]|uniref:vasorin-like n=1 Tax=Anguilla anguilla TaxID=7936 RepID=UPI0015AA63C5|nr:vasorin-like [Anguilla anguilla]XP_035259236.1 vasorin-like [Anguilla anguilla]
MKPFLLLLLFLLLSAQALTSDCPQDCSCPDRDSIFCYQRRSSSVPQGLPAPTKNLYLFQNGISTLSRDDFAGLSGLEMLDLSQNLLSEISDRAFELLSSLHNLDLSSNLITRVHRDSFSGLTLLQRLYLHGNHIQSIHPEAFRGLDQLLELKLQGNQLTGLPALRLPRLLLLDLSHNAGLSPPASADLQTPNLESLKMAGLGISQLSGDLLRSLGNLHELDVSRNQLREVPVALGEAGRGLTQLSLAGNPIAQPGPRPEELQNLRGLQELDLSGLNMQGLPEGFRHLFPRLRLLTAAENPFNCLCPLAWLPGWLREGRVQLGRPEETRCHFPPLNAGKVLARLERADFGCPPTTAAPASTVRSSTPPPRPPQIFSTPPGTTPPPALPPPPPPPLPSDTPSPVEYDNKPPLSPASPSSSSREAMDSDPHICPSNICLNGGTCLLHAQGELECACSRGTSGPYCETREELPPPPPPPPPHHLPLVPPTLVAAAPDPDLGSRQVTSTSIVLDLQRFIQKRPYLRGIRLTYRNLSGPDRRPVELSVPASYPEYTLRGLRPNSTYSICAGPLGASPSGVGADRSCIEAQTAAQLPHRPDPTAVPWNSGATPHAAPEPRVEDGQLVTALAPALAAALTVAVAMAVAAGTVYYLRRRRAKGAHPDMCSEDPSPLELEGVKASLDNGTLPQKQPEIKPASSCPWNGECEVPLMQTHCSANNNLASLKPSYF